MVLIPTDELYIPANEDAIEALLLRNGSLIKGMTDDIKKEIIRELTEGMIRGEGIDQLVKRIERYIGSEEGKGQSRAERIARTEIMYALNKGSLSKYAGDGVEKVEWLAGPDDRCCDTCVNNNGKVFKISEAPSIPIHPNCRCCWIAYFDDE